MSYPVKKIRSKGNFVLIEWFEGVTPHRSWLPEEAVFQKTTDGGSVYFTQNPKHGIPYGIDFREFKLEFDGSVFDQLLKSNGIWTYQDLLEKSDIARSAFNSALAAHFSKLVLYVREHHLASVSGATE